MPLHDRIVSYLERAGLYHLARLNARWFWLDEPLTSAFIERWRPEMHTFYSLARRDACCSSKDSHRGAQSIMACMYLSDLLRRY
ncbi:hypothetical protein AHAS_Ahas11G0045900 [Arachis hypogaea]